jgi:hypothetical protein
MGKGSNFAILFKNSKATVAYKQASSHTEDKDINSGHNSLVTALRNREV